MWHVFVALNGSVLPGFDGEILAVTVAGFSGLMLLLAGAAAALICGAKLGAARTFPSHGKGPAPVRGPVDRADAAGMAYAPYKMIPATTAETLCPDQFGMNQT